MKGNIFMLVTLGLVVGACEPQPNPKVTNNVQDHDSIGLNVPENNLLITIDPTESVEENQIDSNQL